MPAEKPPTDEIKSLTGLWGIAAIYVGVLHYLGPSPAETFSTPFATLLAHGYLAVDLFFVLSGFVMALNYSHMFSHRWSIDAYLKFLGRRIARVYPLYLAATVAGFFLVLAGWLTYENANQLGATVILNMLMVQDWGFVKSIDGPAWSISAEWAAYILFPLLLVPTMFRRPSAAWVSALVCSAVLGALCAIPGSLIHGLRTSQGSFNYYGPEFGLALLRCLPEFVLGILAFRLLGTLFGCGLGSSRWIAPAICLTTLALLATPRTDLAVVLLFPLHIVSMTSGTDLPGRILASPPAQLAGALSYSIYLMHALVLFALHGIRVFAQARGLAHSEGYGALGAIAIAFAIAYVAYLTIEVPGRRWLRTRFEGPFAGREIPPVPHVAVVGGASGGDLVKTGAAMAEALPHWCPYYLVREHRSGEPLKIGWTC